MLSPRSLHSVTMTRSRRHAAREGSSWPYENPARASDGPDLQSACLQEQREAEGIPELSSGAILLHSPWMMHVREIQTEHGRRCSTVVKSGVLTCPVLGRSMFDPGHPRARQSTFRVRSHALFCLRLLQAEGTSYCRLNPQFIDDVLHLKQAHTQEKGARLIVLDRCVVHVVCVCVCVCARMCVCVCVCLCVRMCMHGALHGPPACVHSKPSLFRRSLS